MVTVKAQPLTQVAFKPFGKAVGPPQGSPTFESDTFSYWKMQAVFSAGALLEAGLLRVKRPPRTYSKLEKHVKTPEMLIGLGKGFILPVATSPKAKAVRAFHVRADQAVIMKKGCWHFLPIPERGSEVSILVVFKANTSARDLVTRELDGEVLIER